MFLFCGSTTTRITFFLLEPHTAGQVLKAYLIFQGHERGRKWKTFWFTTYSFGDDFLIFSFSHIFFTRDSLVFLCCLALLFCCSCTRRPPPSRLKASHFAAPVVVSWSSREVGVGRLRSGGWNGLLRQQKHAISGHFYVDNSHEWLPT